jgi:hypothetical protein
MNTVYAWIAAVACGDLAMTVAAFFNSLLSGSHYVDAVDRRFAKLSGWLKNGELMRSLVGPPPVAKFKRPA